MNNSAVDQLEQVLSTRSQPLLIRIDENDCIVAAHYELDSKYAVGIQFRHAEGPIDIGFDRPSRLEYFTDCITNFESLNCDDKREALIEEMGCEDLLPITKPEEIEAWLAQPINDDQVEQWVESVDDELGECTPGFLIMNSVTRSEAEELGIEYYYSGGPGGGSEYKVQFRGDPDDLQNFLAKRKLPLALVFSRE